MQHIPFKPTKIEVVPVGGFLNLIIDPVETLANPDGAEIVAEIYRSLTKRQGFPIAFTGDDLTNLIRASQLPAGKRMLLKVES